MKPVFRHRLAPFVIAVTLLMLASAMVSPVGARDAAAPSPVVLPRDEAPHDVATEWWYLTGHLRTDDHRLFGFQHVFFRAVRGGLKGIVAHAAVTDSEAGEFAYDQRAQLDRHPRDSTSSLHLQLDDWELGGADGVYTIAARVPGYAFRLRLVATKPAVLHTGDGYFLGATGQPSYYYSFPRMQVTGELTAGQQILPVRGQAWMDHQWGDFTNLSAAGWDWLAVQLDDGREVMVFLFRDPEGLRHFGAATLVDRDGAAQALTADQVELVPLQTWTSATSGATYPIAWRLTIARADLDVVVTAVLSDQELDTRRTTGLTYWEGQALVQGSVADERVTGLAYVELTGYARERDGAVP